MGEDDQREGIEGQRAIVLIITLLSHFTVEEMEAQGD